ncbi:MAG TPA: EAL domain-containing response regulator [Ideonella sp.]|uniref:EAL domain-containing response regulator n=1 Tax=Ideonella sp. TaxID=1929293 RepID=UPI002BDC1A49|nr:EAL domain-containing response regulator [Ideonella sp.]HSI47473.1 EAL domain-containing response regulator [Ideonella sp.]
MTQHGNIACPVGSLLIVDDSAAQRTHATDLCRQFGVPLIYEAATGSEALELLGLLALSPDLLIVDLEMPGMDGVELIQQLHQRQIHIPLVVASGRELALIHSVELMARNLGLPVLGWLQKPLTLPPLQAMLQRFGELADGQCPDSPTDPADPAASICREDLASAIASGELGVHYQPKVDMRTGIVRGVEALARWHRHGTGFVRPDLFVALAEEEDLIHELTLSVMGQALAQAAEWNARGLKLSMAINLSQRLLDRPSLVDEVTALVQQRGLKPDQVVLEITESTLADRLGAALGALARLRLKGFGLSIDDYGTGFSSMQQLARIPFTELKIDRSFVHGAHQRSNLRVILQSALELARQLGLVTVAEGVETLEDWRLLQQGGCNMGQGYLIAKPMPASEMLQWIKRHQPRLRELRHESAAANPSPELPPENPALQ